MARDRAPVIFGHEVRDFDLALTAAGTELFTELRKVAAAVDDPVQMRNIEVTTKFGVTFATTPGSETTAMHVGGITGLFKWPDLAADPTTATINTKESGKVIGRRLFAAIGTFPSSVTVRAKRLNIKPGESLWMFTHFVRQSATTSDLVGITMAKWEELTG